jgi:hypothetical protein
MEEEEQFWLHNIKAHGYSVMLYWLLSNDMFKHEGPGQTMVQQSHNKSMPVQTADSVNVFVLWPDQ